MHSQKHSTPKPVSKNNTPATQHSPLLHTFPCLATNSHPSPFANRINYFYNNFTPLLLSNSGHSNARPTLIHPLHPSNLFPPIYNLNSQHMPDSTKFTQYIIVVIASTPHQPTLPNSPSTQPLSPTPPHPTTSK